MLLFLVQLAFTTACSCFQIHLYTPFKSKSRCAVFAVVVVMSAALFVYTHEHPFSPLLFVGDLLLAAGASAMGLWCCKTELFCGIYNVVIQLCINGIVLSSCFTAASRLALDPMKAALFRLAVSLLLSGAWLWIMYRLRRAVWVYMPMPDTYYRGVTCLVCADYCLILGAGRFPPGAQFALMVVCLVVVIAVLHAIRMPQYVIQERERTRILLYQQQAMQAYIDSYQKNEESMRTLRHDVKHMVSTVTELIEEHEYEQARTLSRQVSDWVDRASRPEYSSDMLVNAILKDYAARFSAADIPLDITVQLTTKICLSDMELTTLLHNVLSNALEYCTSPERSGSMWTKIRLSTNRNYFILECSNPLETQLRIVGEKILSSKKEDVLLHGIGLESIKTIARRYDGDVDISTDNGQFTVALMLLNRPVTDG